MLIMKLLLSALWEAPAWQTRDSSWLPALSERRENQLIWSGGHFGSLALFCLLRSCVLLSFFLWLPPCLCHLPSFSHLRPSPQETPNRLCGVKRARWLLTCGAPQNCRSSRAMGRYEYTLMYIIGSFPDLMFGYPSVFLFVKFETIFPVREDFIFDCPAREGFNYPVRPLLIGNLGWQFLVKYIYRWAPSCRNIFSLCPKFDLYIEEMYWKESSDTKQTVSLV